GGVTFSSGTSGITESSAPFIANLVADPADANTLYFGGETNLWLSRDFAASWSSAIATDSAGNVSSIAVSPLDSDTVMFGTAKGLVFRTSNATQASITWTSVQLRSGGFVFSSALDPVSPNIAYAVVSTLKGNNANAAHVYRSTDSGRTWSPRDGTGAAAI